MTTTKITSAPETPNAETTKQRYNANKQNPILLTNELSKFRCNLSKLISYIEQQEQEQQQIQNNNVEYYKLITSNTDFLLNYFGTLSKCRIFVSCFYNGDNGYDDGYLINIIDLFLNFMRVCCKILTCLDTKCYDHGKDDYYCYIEQNVKDIDDMDDLGMIKDEDVETPNFILHDALIVTLGTIRDLACGNGTIRKRIWSNSSTTASNIENDSTNNATCSISMFLSLLTRFKTKTNDITKYEMEHNNMFTTITTQTTKKEIYQNLSWKKEIRSWTNALGVLRNITHSACNNYCCYFHSNVNGTNELISILTKWCYDPSIITNCSTTLNNNQQAEENNNYEEEKKQFHKITLHLPPVRSPTREPCFRSMATILNLCEKCITVSNYISTLPNIVQLLVDCIYGNGMNYYNTNAMIKYKKKKNKHPLLPPGLINILKCVRQNHEENKNAIINDRRHNKTILCFTEEYRDILHGEESRKVLAQVRELERKKKKENSDK